MEPWPSTKIQSPIPSARSTSHSAAPLTKSAMTRSTATPQPSIMMPVWPVGTKTADEARPQGRPAELEGHGHLADGAVAADGQDHAAARPVRAARGHVVALGRAAVVDELHAVDVREGPELGVVGHELVEARNDIQALLDGGHDDGPPRRRDPAALRRDAEEERRGTLGERILQRGHDGRVALRTQPLGHVPSGAGAVDDGDHRVRAVGDDAHGGLGGQVAERALGKDDVAATSIPAHVRLGCHPPDCSLPQTRRTPPGRGPGA